MKTLIAAAIVAQASVGLFVTASPLNVDLTGRALPELVSATTAKTYLAACKRSLLFYSTPMAYRASCLLAHLGYSTIGLQRTHMLVHKEGAMAFGVERCLPDPLWTCIASQTLTFPMFLVTVTPETNGDTCMSNALYIVTLT